MYTAAVSTINRIIAEYGIEPYKTRFLKRRHDTSKIDTPTKLQAYLSAYHKHSFVITERGRPGRHKPKPWELEDQRLPDTKMMDNGIGYVKYYQYSGYDKNTETQMVQKVERLLKRKLTGLIIDLRYHSGGNMWPQLKSLRKIIANCKLISMTDGKSYISIDKTGHVNHNSTVRKKQLSTDMPIAVLIGRNTVSSGEIIAMIFDHRKNCKLFGHKTGGFLTVNDGPIPINHKFKMFLTIGYLTTIDGKTHRTEYVMPHVTTDEPIEDAVKWITSVAG